MSFFAPYRGEAGGGRNPVQPGRQVSTAPADPWEQQLQQILDQRYGAGSPQAQQEFQYYRQKRASDEVSGRAGAGLEFPNMDAYWLHRATGTDPQDQPGGGGGMNLAGMGGGMGNNLPAGYLATPANINVAMPRPEELGSSPAFQWTMSRGLDALNKSHAARGTIGGGGAAKDAAEFAAGAASSEYDKELGRRMGVAGFNRDSIWGDTDRIFGRHYNLANLGANAASSYANNVSDLYASGASANAQNAMNRGSNWGNLAGLGADLLGAYFGNRGK